MRKFTEQGSACLLMRHSELKVEAPDFILARPTVASAKSMSVLSVFWGNHKGVKVICVFSSGFKRSLEKIFSLVRQWPQSVPVSARHCW